MQTTALAAPVEQAKASPGPDLIRDVSAGICFTCTACNPPRGQGSAGLGAAGQPVIQPGQVPARHCGCGGHQAGAGAALLSQWHATHCRVLLGKHQGLPTCTCHLPAHSRKAVRPAALVVLAAASRDCCGHELTGNAVLQCTGWRHKAQHVRAASSKLALLAWWFGSSSGDCMAAARQPGSCWSPPEAKASKQCASNR